MRTRVKRSDVRGSIENHSVSFDFGLDAFDQVARVFLLVLSLILPSCFIGTLQTDVYLHSFLLLTTRRFLSLIEWLLGSLLSIFVAGG